MRILQVVPRYAPAWAFGGGVRMTYELASAWVRDGHQVTVFTSDQQDATRRFADATSDVEGIQVRRFPNLSHRLASRYSFLFFRPRGMTKALKMAAGQFDVVHVAESRGPHNRWVMQQVPPLGIPVAWSAYGGLAEGEGVRRIYRAMHDRFFGTRRLVQASSALIAQTSHERGTYLRFGANPSQIHLIPLAVNWNDFSTLPARGQFRRKLGLGAAEKLVLFVGRIHATKGLQVLIPAFARAARRFPEARLAVVGWDHGFLGTARKIVAELGLTEKVFFPGPLYGPERLTAYADASVFALTPGVYEETSLAALEACACGAACVITRQCEIPGLDDAGGGRTVDYNVAAVADALEAALTGDTASTWGQRARSMVHQRFTSERVARQHVQVFETLGGLAVPSGGP